MKRENSNDHLKNIHTKNTSSPGIHEDFIAQVAEKIGGKVKKKLSQEFSRTESRILSAFSRLDEILQNPQPRPRNGTVPEFE